MKIAINAQIFASSVTALLCFVSTGVFAVAVPNDSTDINKPISVLMPIDEQRVGQVAKLLPEKPHGFGETYHDRAAWNRLYQNPAYQKVVRKAETLLSQPFPTWDDSQYLIYFTKGTRPEGEQMMRARSGWLPTLVWAECLENKGRFVPLLETVLTELTHQKSWVLPAHDKNHQNFDGTNHTVDLSSAKFAHALAEAVYLLDDKLSAKLRADILREIRLRVFEPVLNTIATKNGDNFWLTVTTNWNAVCLSGVTGAALAILPDRSERARFVTIAERYAKNSIAGFTDEGYSTEGLGYYGYGFGNYTLLREGVWQATHGQVDLFADLKIKRIGMYVPDLEIINGIYPKIADCRLSAAVPADVLWYCNRTLQLGLKKYDTLSFDGQTGNLIDDVMHAFPNSASMAKPAPERPAASRLRSYFSQAQVLITRPADGSPCRIGTALQGGNNNEMHNHNDIGSFNVVVGDELLMGDPGGPYAYTAKTFGPERYTLYKSLASYGHPVPVVAGTEQQGGAAAQARILTTDFTDQQDRYVMDITSAYPAPTLTSLVRGFTYNREGDGYLAVRDDFQFTSPQPFELALITRVSWKQIAPNQIEFTGRTEKMIATIQGMTGGFTVKSETIEENSPAFTRIGLVFQPAQKGSVTVTFRPVRL